MTVRLSCEVGFVYRYESREYIIERLARLEVGEAVKS